MSLVSYAQNFEDVMLWRALKHISEGFYIDVGANDPSVDSVTRVFYEHGWHGINIEPLPNHAADLRAQRRRDINIQCAAGAESGELELWECDVRGWATAFPETVAQHTASGHSGIFHKVSVRRLAEICEEFVSSDIHFLKIDVEGFEEPVLRGMDFSKFRPWILVVEATKPNTTTEAYDEWEGIVLGAGYRLAYCDGLNRFYVASEHSELLDLLRYPPNVFDGFIRSEQWNSELRAQQTEARAATAETALEAARKELHDIHQAHRYQYHLAEERHQQIQALLADHSNAIAALEAARKELHDIHQAHRYQYHLAEERHQQIQALLASTSWRMTAPFRGVASAMRGFTRNALKSRARILLKRAALYVGRRPRLKNAAIKILNRFPLLRSWLFRAIAGVNAQPFQPQHMPTTDLEHLTPRGRHIYAELKFMIERRQRENGRCAS